VKSLLNRRPSPAMVIALIALFVSLSGVSYGVATGFIDSREIKNNEVRSLDIRNNEVRTRDLRNNEVRGIDIRNSTVQGRDLALNTVTGDDVREDSLGKVPSAGTADSAGTAGSADSVGGHTFGEVRYTGEVGSAFVQVLNLGGLRVEARCLSGPRMQVRAFSDAPGSELTAEFPNTPGSVEANGMNTELVLEDGTGTEDGFARIEYAGVDGRTVSFHGFTNLEANGVQGTTNDCGLFGVASSG
jgi:hypothetical protein